MTMTRVPTWPKYVHLFGFCLLLLPNGVTMYWGNLLVYTYSYYKVVLGIHKDPDSPWLVSLNGVFWKLGTTFTLCTGIVVCDGAWFISIAALTLVSIPLELTLGIMCGSSLGLIFGAAYSFARRTFPKRYALAVAVIQASPLLGSIGINQFLTAYLNPESRVPDGREGTLIYFTNSGVKKVPRCFLIIALFSLSMHLLGFLCMKIGRNINIEDDCAVLESSYKQMSCYESNGMSKIPAQDREITNGKKTKSYTESDAILNHSKQESCGQAEIEHQRENESLTITAIMKNPSFFVLVACYVVIEINFSSILNFYKVFGQLSIQDDNFLTAVGSSMLIVSALISWFLGNLMDRWETKIFTACMIGILAVLSYMYCSSILLGKWVFALATMIYLSFSWAGYLLVNLVSLKAFGSSSHDYAFGLVSSFNVPASLAWPLIAETIIEHFSFSGLFVSLGMMHTVCLLMTIPILQLKYS